MNVWPSTEAWKIVKEEFSGKLDKAFERGILGC
jgi:hypothetical protein